MTETIEEPPVDAPGESPPEPPPVDAPAPGVPVEEEPPAPPPTPAESDPTVHSLAAMLTIVHGVPAAPAADVAALRAYLDPVTAPVLVQQRPLLGQATPPNLDDVPVDDQPAVIAAWVADVVAQAGWEYAEVSL